MIIERSACILLQGQDMEYEQQPIARVVRVSVGTAQSLQAGHHA